MLISVFKILARQRVEYICDPSTAKRLKWRELPPTQKQTTLTTAIAMRLPPDLRRGQCAHFQTSAARSAEFTSRSSQPSDQQSGVALPRAAALLKSFWTEPQKLLLPYPNRLPANGLFFRFSFCSSFSFSLVIVLVLVLDLVVELVQLQHFQLSFQLQRLFQLQCQFYYYARMQHSFRRSVTQTVCLSLFTKPQAMRLSSQLLHGEFSDLNNDKIQREAAIHSFQFFLIFQTGTPMKLSNQSATSPNSRHHTERRHQRYAQLNLFTCQNSMTVLELWLQKMIRKRMDLRISSSPP